jgi:hypothetical protein
MGVMICDATSTHPAVKQVFISLERKSSILIRKTESLQMVRQQLYMCSGTRRMISVERATDLATLTFQVLMVPGTHDF